MNIDYFIKIVLDIFFIFIFTCWVRYSFKTEKGLSYKALTILLLTNKVASTIEKFSENIYNHIYFIFYIIQCIALIIILYSGLKSLFTLIKKFNNEKIKIEY
ncbi:hypothetical protein [Clostridium sardiniense]|uniref:hypothetical protein n=1 Tax=Clostridium sardiniense TaxID=29369 RepID=UPI0019591493|nr:hypothetical protein [Clostridium sardiniense]MBM7834953.1 hypothetical protein [Clostridium sardiniense]